MKRLETFAALAVCVIAGSIAEPALGGSVPVVVLPLAWICIVAVEQGSLTGVLMGLAGGLLVDLLENCPLGMNAGTLAVLGFLFARAGRILSFWPRPLKTAGAGFLSVLYIPLSALFAGLAGIRTSWSLSLSLQFVTAMIACALLLVFFRPADRTAPSR